MTGFFVTLEGIDGAGKTTVAEAICDAYDRTVHTCEPSDLWTGKQVRRAIASESDTHPLTDFYLFMADRVHHIENRIKPALEAGQIVVSDRYADSTFAYQPWALRGALSTPESYIEDVMGPWHFHPDLTLYLDISVNTSLERVGDGSDSYENAEFLREVHLNYERLADRFSDRYVRIDAEQPIEAVCADALAAIDERTG